MHQLIAPLGRRAEIRQKRPVGPINEYTPISTFSIGDMPAEARYKALSVAMLRASQFCSGVGSSALGQGSAPSRQSPLHHVEGEKTLKWINALELGQWADTLQGRDKMRSPMMGGQSRPKVWNDR